MLMFKWPITLQLIVREFLLDPHHARLLVCSELVQTPQSVLDALNGSDSVDRVEVRGVHRFPTNEKVGNAFVALDQTERGVLASAEDLESPERAAGLEGLIVAPGEDGLSQSVCRFFTSALAGKDAVSNGHFEVGGVARAAR